MKCNVCWNSIETTCYVTRCSHVFCQQDAEKHFNEEMMCPACEKPLTQRDIRKVDLEGGFDDKIFSLCGYPPEVILESTRSALKFWDNQKDLEVRYQQYLNKETLNKSQKMERSYHEQLVEAKSSLAVMSKRAHSTDQEHEMTRKELSDLQDKYQDRVREKTKLEELYNTLKRKYDQMCRESISSHRLPVQLEDTLPLSTTTHSYREQRAQPVTSAAPVRSDFKSTFQHKQMAKPMERNLSPNFLHGSSPNFLVSKDSRQSARTVVSKPSLFGNRTALFSPIKKPRPSSPIINSRISPLQLAK